MLLILWRSFLKLQLCINCVRLRVAEHYFCVPPIELYVSMRCIRVFEATYEHVVVELKPNPLKIQLVLIAFNFGIQLVYYFSYTPDDSAKCINT